MSLFLFETIKCSEGKLYNLEYHQQRLELSQQQQFPNAVLIELRQAIEIPEHAKTGLFRCRVTYGERIEKMEFIPHQYRKIESLKLVEDNSIDYSSKYADRECLQQLFERRGNCDDVLIVKNGCLTDSSAANTVFFDGSQWWTPDSPLLPGTQRARLLDEGKIKSCRITLADLPKYQQIGLINAMQDLDSMPVISTDFVGF